MALSVPAGTGAGCAPSCAAVARKTLPNSAIRPRKKSGPIRFGCANRLVVLTPNISTTDGTQFLEFSNNVRPDQQSQNILARKASSRDTLARAFQRSGILGHKE